MEWKEYKLFVPPKATDLVALRLYEWGSNGAVIQDDILDENGNCCITAYFPAENNGIEGTIKNELSRMIHAGVINETCSVQTDVVKDDTWLYAWQKYFHAHKISKRFWVTPAWEQAEAEGDDLVVKIDPGCAFGSGIHETTCMCIDYLEKSVRSGDMIIDVGTGTGILAIVAAKLGAGHVTAVDNDVRAISQAKINIGLNGVDGQVNAESSDLLTAVAHLDGKVDIVVANIVADAIVALLETAGSYLKEGGIFIASGIIDDRLEDVRQAVSHSGFEWVDEQERNGWYAVQLRWHS